MAASEYHHGEMDIHDQQATWDGFIKGTTWGSLILALMLGHAVMTIALGLHWAVSLGLMALVGIGSGIVLNLGGRWYATLVILLLTGLFITFAYRLSGFLAVVALGCYALISYAILIALGATLTLPGLAGFVLAIGMAIDANVLVFERAKEESSEQKAPPAKAIATGFSKAWSAILDSNVTTLLAGGLLFFLATGPVRGFGVTLTIGVVASMFSAMVISRVLVEFAASRKAVRRRPALTGFALRGCLTSRRRRLRHL